MRLLEIVEIQKQGVNFHERFKPLDKLRNWQILADKITNRENKFYNFIQIKISTNAREVTNWDQPIIQSFRSSKLILLCRITRGYLELLLKFQPEAGLINYLCITNSLSINYDFADIYDFILNKWLEQNPYNVLNSIVVKNSEEGGRFYHDKNTYKIFIYSELAKFPELPKKFQWFTLKEVKELINIGDLLTNELRSLIAILFAI